MLTLRHALRALSKAPGFALLAVGILALGIGASTAIFSVVNALLLQPLAYQDARRLVQVNSRHPEQGVSALAPATFIDTAAGIRSFAVLAAQTYDYVNLTGAASPQRLTGAQGTADYFKLFGIQPLLGRTWTEAETRAAAAPVVVLAEGLWREQFGGRADIVGKTILLDDVAHTVLGVMPARFTDPWGNARLWRPLKLDGAVGQVRTDRYFSTFGRLRDGVSLEAANAELAAFGAGLAATHPEHYRGWTLGASDLHALVVGDYRTGLLVVLGAVGCVLAITCANVAGLSLVRALGRRKELAIRAAIGASGGQLLRQLLTESLLLALAGGALGMLLAQWGVSAILGFIGDGWLPRMGEIAINAPVLIAALGLTLATGLLFGLAPAWSAARTDPHDSLKENSGRGTAGPGARKLRSGLVVLEIALALVLLLGAGLLARSFAHILARPAGLRPDNVLAVGVSLAAKRHDTADKRRAFYARIAEAVAALPGVQSAGFTHTLPFTWGIPFTLVPVGPSLVGERTTPSAFYDSVSPDYFAAAGIPLVAGRGFTPADDARAPGVVLISAATARRFFGAENPLGRRLRGTDPANPAEFEIVGVVGDVLRTGLAANEVPLQIYRPLAQRPTWFATLLVRTAVPPETLTRAVREAIWSVDPDQPVETVSSLDRLIANSVTQPRLYLTLFGLFAGLAMLLAAIGLYGLIAYGVAQRTREFGIRAALGASPRDLLQGVLREGLRLTGIGLVLGLLGGIAGASLLRDLVSGTPLHDPLLFLGVAALLGLVALAACLVPARRATRVDPSIALRSE